MSDLDLSEVSQEPYQFATDETRLRAKPEPLLEWAESKKLNSVLLESAFMIRKAVKYIRSDVDQKGVNYLELDAPGGRHNRVVDDEREPPEVKRYMVWSTVMIGRFGSRGLTMVVDCIVEGSYCPLPLMKESLRVF